MKAIILAASAAGADAETAQKAIAGILRAGLDALAKGDAAH